MAYHPLPNVLSSRLIGHTECPRNSLAFLRVPWVHASTFPCMGFRSSVQIPGRFHVPPKRSGYFSANFSRTTGNLAMGPEEVGTAQEGLLSRVVQLLQSFTKQPFRHAVLRAGHFPGPHFTATRVNGFSHLHFPGLTGPVNMLRRACSIQNCGLKLLTDPGTEFPQLPSRVVTTDPRSGEYGNCRLTGRMPHFHHAPISKAEGLQANFLAPRVLLPPTRATSRGSRMMRTIGDAGKQLRIIRTNRR